jgi:hypothetical protein
MADMFIKEKKLYEAMLIINIVFYNKRKTVHDIKRNIISGQEEEKLDINNGK